jgi:hypothetical protein
MPKIERLNRLIARMGRDGRAEPEPRTLEDWVNAVLQNDELATDEELIEFFMSEGPMGREEAEDAVSQRGQALRDRHYRVEIGAREYEHEDEPEYVIEVNVGGGGEFSGDQFWTGLGFSPEYPDAEIFRDLQEARDAALKIQRDSEAGKHEVFEDIWVYSDYGLNSQEVVFHI